MKLNLLIRLFIIAIIFNSCNVPNENVKVIDLEKDLDSMLQADFEKNQLVGMSVVVIGGGKTIFHGSYGYSNVAQQQKINNQTKYRIASISKTVTALAAMQLVEQKKIDLDTDVSTYLGWTLRNPKFLNEPITLRQLMSHQSGIQDGKGYFNFSGDMVAKNLQLKELFSPDGSYYTDDIFTNHKPGTYFSYTNCTWGIIASIIEIISGERFDAYVRNHIMKPLQLNADFNVLELNSLSNLAILYRWNNGEWKPQADDYTSEQPTERASTNYVLGQNGLLYGPQGSLRISLEDLAVIAQLFIQGGTYNGTTILQNKSIDNMTANHWDYQINNGDTWGDFFLSYGFGVQRITNKDAADIIFPDRKMVGHPGIAYGLLSDMYVDPETKSGILFCTNGSKLEYKYGTETTFYQIEEDVFKSVYEYLKDWEKGSFSQKP
jgi:CubicO group peptidase (beta-lactamase class C family)